MTHTTHPLPCPSCGGNTTAGALCHHRNPTCRGCCGCCEAEHYEWEAA